VQGIGEREPLEGEAAEELWDDDAFDFLSPGGGRRAQHVTPEAIERIAER